MKQISDQIPINPTLEQVMVYQHDHQILLNCCELLNCKPDQLVQRITMLLDEIEEMKQEYAALKKHLDESYKAQKRLESLKT